MLALYIFLAFLSFFFFLLIATTTTTSCWSSDTYNPVPGVMENVPSSRGYTGGFACDLMAKDVSLAVSAAHSVKSPLPLGGSVLQLYNLLHKQGASFVVCFFFSPTQRPPPFFFALGYGGKDFSAVFEFLSKKQ